MSKPYLNVAALPLGEAVMLTVQNDNLRSFTVNPECMPCSIKHVRNLRGPWSPRAEVAPVFAGVLMEPGGSVIVSAGRLLVWSM